MFDLPPRSKFKNKKDESTVNSVTLKWCTLLDEFRTACVGFKLSKAI